MPPETVVTHDPLSNPLLWGGFIVFMLVAMVLDLGIGKRNKSMSTRTALTWCVVWVSLALLFNGYVYTSFGATAAQEFFAGYLLEYSLSVDNLFVFVLVFAKFRTPLKLQHRALVWGIIGAMFLRAAMILTGAALIHKFHWVMALFGAFLVFTGFKLMFNHDDDDEDPTQMWIVKFLQTKLRLTDGYRGEAFWVYENGKRHFTHLFLVVLIIEFSDVIFAVDSVPAIFGVTQDPFIVFTSNMFAILGLRSLYFAIAGAIQKLRFLNYGLALVLAFIGVKMLLPFVPAVLTAISVDHGLTDESLKLSTMASLAVICSVLGITTVLSLVIKPGGKGDEGAAPTPTEESPEGSEPPSAELTDQAPTPEAEAVEAAAEAGSETDKDTP